MGFRCFCCLYDFMLFIPQTAFTLWGSHACLNTRCGETPPGRLRGCSFLLLFTALGDGTMRLVQARRSPMHVLTVKHNGFERSNAPIPHVAQIPPETPNGPQMLHISMAPIDPYYEYSIYISNE